MRSKLALGCLLALLAATAPAPAGDVINVTDTIRIDLTGFTSFNPYADDGNGEIVDFHGYLHVTFHFTLPEDGSGNFVQNYSFANMYGVGRTSGAIYRLVGSYRLITTYFPGDLPKTDALIVHTRLCAQGNEEPSYTDHIVFHTTIQPNGAIAITAATE